MKGTETSGVQSVSQSAECAKRIGDLIAWVDARKAEPAFSQEVASRRGRAATVVTSDDELLRFLARVIAYSQGARSDAVTELLERDDWEQAFRGFRVSEVARLDTETLMHDYWRQFGAIRFQRKVKAIVGCALALERIASQGVPLHRVIEAARVPEELTDVADVNRFWTAFGSVQACTVAAAMPFFTSATSLLHLLLDLGFPCAKPDRIVMDVAVRLGLAAKPTGERNLVGTVREMQMYSATHRIAPAVMDLYFLIYGGQLSTQTLLRPEFRGKSTQGPF